MSVEHAANQAGTKAHVFSADDFTLDSLRACKGGLKVSICLPAHNEESTVGPIVESIVSHFMQDPDTTDPTAADSRTADSATDPGTAGSTAVSLVDELVVVDDCSTDGTAAAAAAAGAKVVTVSELLPEAGVGSGKGNAMWKSVAAVSGDVIAWIDADLTSFTPSYVLGLLGPLLGDPDIAMVKGFYERPSSAGASGGRTTELMARPLLSTFFGELSFIRQPLGGEYAVRREFVEQVPFAQGYGVETGLLIDLARLVGTDRIAQVDLGVRTHRSRPLHALSAQAMEVLHAVLHRIDVDWQPDLSTALHRVDAEPTEIRTAERPPLIRTPGYRRG